jgi:hypothetical protein
MEMMDIVTENVFEIPSYRGTFTEDKDKLKRISDYLKKVSCDVDNQKTTDPNHILYQDYSIPNSVTEECPIVVELVESICDTLVNKWGGQLEIVDEPWTIVNGPREQIYPHDHKKDPCDWAVVYWAKVPINSGDLEFWPYGVCDRAIKSVTPEEGDFLVFPGNLVHGVRHNGSNEDRISMSFNISSTNHYHF